MPSRLPPIAGLPEAEFIAELRRLDGTPEEVFADPELVELLLPTLRADFSMLESYQPRDNPTLSLPLVTYRGDTDHDVTADGVAAWSELTSGPVEHRVVSGGHFFLTEDPAALARAVVADLAEQT